MSKKLSPFLLIIMILGFLHTLLFVLFWLTNSLFYAEVNAFLFEKLGRGLDYVRLVLVFSALLLLWSSAQLIYIRLRRKKIGWGSWLYVISAT